MLDAENRMVSFRTGLPSKKKDWGSLHEIAHEFIDWQRELLYYCPLLLLDVGVQRQFEAEADLFAAEAFFFGDRFNKHAAEGDFGLNTALEMANNLYQTSIHATFAHYAWTNQRPCCLLIWKPGKGNEKLWAPGDLIIQYYVASESFQAYVDPGQAADPDEAVVELFTSPTLNGVVEHEMIFESRLGKKYVAQAESFSNSYKVFTLIFDLTPVGAGISG